MRINCHESPAWLKTPCICVLSLFCRGRGGERKGLSTYMTVCEWGCEEAEKNGEGSQWPSRWRAIDLIS